MGLEDKVSVMKLQRKLLQGVAKAIIIGTLSIATTSCGGGGGNTSGGASGVVPPPPPPPTNQAPSPSAKVNNPSPQEGQPFELDASESSDPEGETLTYSWSQTAGPTIALSDTTSQTIALNAPEVTQDETATFQLSVSDGTNTATQTVDVVFTNIAQTPVFPVSFGTQVEAIFQRPVRGLVDTGNGNRTGYILFSDTDTSPISIEEIERNSTGDIVLSPTNAFIDTFEQPVSFHTESPIELLGRGSFEIDTVEENENKVTIYNVTDPNSNGDSGPARVENEYTVTSPCAVARLDFTYAAQRTLLIGQRAGGLSIAGNFLTDPDDASSTREEGVMPFLPSNSSMCVIHSLSFAITGEEITNRQSFPDFISIDTDAHTINLFSLTEAGQANRRMEYELRESVNIDLQTSQDLEFISSTPIQEGLIEKSGFLMTFSDKKHEGTHRLVAVGIDADRKIVQQTSQWDLGVPSDIFFGSVDRSNNPYEVMVVSSTSPQAIIFQGSNTEVSLNPRPGVIIPASILPLKEPSYLEIGLGAEKVENVVANQPGIFVTYPQQQKITFFSDPESTQ